MAKAFTIPKSPAACADLLFTTREKRLVIQKEAEALEKQEAAIKDHLIKTLPKNDAGGIQGKLARVTLVTKSKPTVEIWDEFYAYISRTKSFELLQKRVNEAAVIERWENKKEVKGVGRFNAVTVSVNKVA
jgi:hypothetical protein